MIVIDNWLKGKQNFYTGRATFNALAANDKLKKFFAKGLNATSKNMLVDELNKMAGKQLVIKSAFLRIEDEMPPGNDNILKALETEWKGMYARMKLLQHSLDKYEGLNTIDAIDACRPICKEVMMLEKRIMEVWNRRDYYIENSKLPGAEIKEIALPEDPVKLSKMLTSLGNNIRRNRRLMQQHPENAKYVQNLAQYREQYKKLTGEEYNERPR